MTDSRTLVARYPEEVWNRGRHELIEELFTDDHVYHDALMPDLPAGPEGVRRRVETYMSAFPDARVSPEEWIVAGDRVVLRWTWGGTNTGEALGLPATGRAATITGMHEFRLRDGRIAESWCSFDSLGLLQQLGLVQLGAPAAA